MMKKLLLMFLIVTCVLSPMDALAEPLAQTQIASQAVTDNGENYELLRATRTIGSLLFADGAVLSYGGFILYNVDDGQTAYTFLLEQNIGGTWYPYTILASGFSNDTYIVREGAVNPPKGYSYRLCITAFSQSISASMGYSLTVNW